MEERKEVLPPVAESQENGITILLGLKGYEVGKVVEGEKEIMVEVRAKEARRCAYCGSIDLYRHGWCQNRKVLHTWSNGKRVYLDLQRQRWKCRSCGRSFSDGAELLRPYSRATRQAEAEALWQLRDRSFSQIKRELGIGYSTLRRLLERETDAEAISTIAGEEELFLGIDEHSFRRQELVHMVTEVKKRRVLGILKDDRIATLKDFLNRIPKGKVKEVCIDMKEALRKAAEGLFPESRLVADPFHVIADSNKRVDEARRIEQDINQKRRVRIPKKIFLIAREKLDEQRTKKIDALLEKYPSMKGFYWTKEKIRELYRQDNREEAARILGSIIFNLKSSDDGELIRWGNTLRHWREPILNYFHSHTTNGFTEGCHTKIKMLKRLSYGLRNVDVYWRKMLLGFVPCRSCFHTI